MDQTTDLASGTAVMVRGTFENRWVPGFEIADHVESGYLLRRLSDGVTLPCVIDDIDIRAL